MKFSGLAEFLLRTPTMLKAVIFVLCICGAWTYEQVLRPNMLAQTGWTQLNSDERKSDNESQEDKTNIMAYKTKNKTSLENRGKFEAMQEDLIKTLLRRTNSKRKLATTAIMSFGTLRPYRGTDSSETIANAGAQTIAGHLLEPHADDTQAKSTREISIFINSQEKNDPNVKVVKEKRNIPWLPSQGLDQDEYQDKGVQTLRKITGTSRPPANTGRQAQTRPVSSSSSLARFNSMFSLIGEPVLLAMGIVGNSLLVVVFLVTPLRLRVVSHTIAAAGICDLLYTAGCLLLHVASRGVQILTLPGACQLITFTLIMSQIMSTWCLFFSHLCRLNAHTKTGHEGRKRRVCKAKFTVIILALLIAAVSVHYLWSMDKVTVAGHIFCAPMPEMVSAHVVLRKVELVIGIVLPFILIAGIDLLLAVKLVVHILVTRWDRLEQEDDVDYYKASSTFGVHKIVKMPLNRQVLKQEEDSIPASNDLAIDLQNNNDTRTRRRSSESSTESQKALPCGFLKHAVHIEVTQEKATGGFDIFINDDDKTQEVSTSLECQQRSQESCFYFSSKVSSDHELFSKDTSEILENGKKCQYHDNKDFLQNEIDCKAIVRSSESVPSEPSVRAPKLEPILELHRDEEELKSKIISENVKAVMDNKPSQEVPSVLPRNSTASSDSSLVGNQSEPLSMPNGDTGTESCMQKDNSQNSGSSFRKKRRLSNLKAVINSITVMKTKTLRAKKVGFMGEVSGDRSQSDLERRKRPRFAFLSYSESGAASKSSNNKYSSYASYMSIDSSLAGSSHRQPEDHEFPDDTTSCTVATILMGFILATLVIPATFRHAVRLFGSPISTPPTRNEIEMAIMNENLMKFAAVFKIFLCVLAMSSFRHAMSWLFRQWLPRKLIKVSNVCCKNEDETDITSAV